MRRDAAPAKSHKTDLYQPADFYEAEGCKMDGGCDETDACTENKGAQTVQASSDRQDAHSPKSSHRTCRRACSECIVRDQDSKCVALVLFTRNCITIESHKIVFELFTNSSNGKTFSTLCNIAFSQHWKVYIRRFTFHTNPFVQHQSGLPPFAVSHRTQFPTQALLELRAQSLSLPQSREPPHVCAW